MLTLIHTARAFAAFWFWPLARAGAGRRLGHRLQPRAGRVARTFVHAVGSRRHQAATRCRPSQRHGLAALWAQGTTWWPKTTLVVLVIMSVSTWYVLITKLLAQRRMGGQGRAAAASFWAADTVRQGADTLDKASPYRFIAESALEATRKHDGLISQVDLNTWVAQSIERAVNTVHSRTQEGLAVLATVGSTAPFVGLFGTVWGIYNALVKIGASRPGPALTAWPARWARR